MTLGSELKPLNAMNNLRLCLTSITLGHQHNALDDMKDLGSCEHKLLDVMNSLGLRII